MSHHIRGLIAREDHLQKAALELAGARVVKLKSGFGFLPITDEFAGDEESVPFEQLHQLTSRLVNWATRVSATFPLACVETEYFGGCGWQTAIAWVNGHVAFGPIRTFDLPEHPPTPLLGGAINQALRLIGVERGMARDEFDALGLGDHRSNEKWLSE